MPQIQRENKKVRRMTAYEVPSKEFHSKIKLLLAGGSEIGWEKQLIT